MISVSIMLMSSPFKFVAYSGCFLSLHDNPEKVQTYFMFVFASGEPTSQEFQTLYIKVLPMCDLKPLFDGVQRGEGMWDVVEQVKCKSHILVQYLTAKRSVEPAIGSIMFTYSVAWKRNNSLKL